MKGKRIAEVGDLVLLDSNYSTMQYIGLKIERGYDMGKWVASPHSYCTEVAILEKNFQETAPIMEAQRMLGVVSDDQGYIFEELPTTETYTTVKITKLSEPASKPVSEMNWKEWCLWIVILICAIFALTYWKIRY